jgi:hypothetical protein
LLGFCFFIFIILLLDSSLGGAALVLFVKRVEEASLLALELSISSAKFKDWELLVFLGDELPLTLETELSKELDFLFMTSRSCLWLLKPSFSRPTAPQSNDRAMERRR